MNSLRGKGINYDTGFFNAGSSTHEPFDPEIVLREMRVMHDVQRGSRPGRGHPLDDRVERQRQADPVEGRLFARRSRTGRLPARVVEIFETDGVDSAFVYTFARYDLPHRDDPRLDLDLASRGGVRVPDRQDSARGLERPAAIPACPGSRRPRSMSSQTATADSARH